MVAVEMECLPREASVMCPVTQLPLALISLACARIVFLLPDHLIVSAFKKTAPAAVEQTWLVSGFKFSAAGIITICGTLGSLPGATSAPASNVFENAVCWIIAEMFRTIWEGCG